MQQHKRATADAQGYLNVGTWSLKWSLWSVNQGCFKAAVALNLQLEENQNSIKSFSQNLTIQQLSATVHVFCHYSMLSFQNSMTDIRLIRFCFTAKMYSGHFRALDGYNEQHQLSLLCHNTVCGHKKLVSHINSAMEQHKWHNCVMMAWNTHFKDTGLYTIFPWWEALIWNLWLHQKHLEIPHLQNPSYRPGYCWGSHCHHHPKKETIQWGWSKKEYVQSSCLSLFLYMVSNVPAKIVLSLWPILQNTTL